MSLSSDGKHTQKLIYIILQAYKASINIYLYIKYTGLIYKPLEITELYHGRDRASTYPSNLYIYKTDSKV